MKHELEQAVAAAILDVYNVEIAVELARPDAQFGDYATNVALQLAKQVGKNPREIAEALAEKLRAHEQLAEVSVAGPGFLNVRLNDTALAGSLLRHSTSSLAGYKYVVEYSCPNYFKELHAGHLYQTILGDVVARLLENAGAEVHRTNFGGDVGLHVAKAIYGMNKTVNGTYNNQDFKNVAKYMHSLEPKKRPSFLASAYVLGSGDYESDTNRAKYWVDDLNAELYHTVFSDVANDYADQTSQDQREVYSMGRDWSREYFDQLYSELDLKKQLDGTFFRYYPESSTAENGKELVWANIVSDKTGDTAAIFELSDGAVIFKGEEQGLHTRVFLTKQGLPTYEAKDLGLIFMEYQDYLFDHRILITGNDQIEYMKVVWKAADLLHPGILNKMTHLANGTIRFGDGKKMSSRLGNVTRAVDVLNTVRELAKEGEAAANAQISLGAVKYEFLKHRLGGDIAFDPKDSVATEGNSGPYLQYAHARARSILAKSQAPNPNDQINSKFEIPDSKFQPDERLLVRKLTEYTEVVEKATTELMPHHICTYLYELAQEFNRFYENNRVIGDDREQLRLKLVSAYADTLKRGLELLGIHAPERM